MVVRGSMRTKRWHHKSRAGCANCRQRRIKCDERRPVCENCERAMVVCVYRQSSSSTVGHGRISAPSSTSLLTEPPCPTPLRQQDLELMHHYCIFTSNVLSDCPVSTAWFREIVPSMVLPYDFASNAMLAVAACHLARLKPDPDRYSHRARLLVEHALTHSRVALQQLDAAQHGALYLAAIFIHTVTLASPSIVYQGNDAVSKFISCAKSWHGVAVMLSTLMGSSAPQQGCLPPHRRQAIYKLPAQQDFFQGLHDIRLIIEEEKASALAHENRERHRVYEVILAELELCYNSAYQRISSALLVRSTTTADWDHFCTLIRDGDVVASLLATCHALIWHQFDHLWFVGGIFADFIRELYLRGCGASEKHARFISWALSWVTSEMSPAVASKIILSPATMSEDRSDASSSQTDYQ